MIHNLTFEHKLVEELPGSGWLPNGKPVGREGFHVVVVERRGTGTRYYCTLAPGDMLRISERLFGNFFGYSVDMRHARQFEIDDFFLTADQLIKVHLRAKILYCVTNSRTVAMEIEDPLGKFRDRIIGVLRREIGNLPYQKVTEVLCEQIINSVGQVQHLGLTVEGIDSVTVALDERVIKSLETKATLSYNQTLAREVENEEYDRQLRTQRREHELQRLNLEAELERERRQQTTEVELQQMAIQNLNLADINTMLHTRPELTGPILERLTARDMQELQLRARTQEQINEHMGRVLMNYINENPDANPEDVMRMIRETYAHTDRPRIMFGNSPLSVDRITFGQIVDSSTPSTTPAPPTGEIEGAQDYDDSGGHTSV